MKKLVYMMVLLFGLTMFGQTVKNKNLKTEIAVNGNCEMCKKRIEKAAMSVSGVKMATWNVEEKKLQLIFNEEKTELKKIEEAIAKVGHDTQNVKAENTIYESLHGCCQYEREK